MNEQLIELRDDQLALLMSAAESVGQADDLVRNHPGLEHAMQCGFSPLAPLGSGGMAEVWRGVDANTGREVAIKAPHKDDPTAAKVLKREAETLSQLHPPHVAALIRQGGEADTRFLVLEFIDGLSIADLAKSQKPPLGELVRLMCKVCEATAYVHHAGFTHGDIKPSNILVRPDGAVLLIDFGLAARADVENAVIVRRTMRGGTPRYLAPELKNRETITAHIPSDIYSLGAAFDHLLELADCKATPALRRVINKACAAASGDRHASAKELATEIKVCGVMGAAPERRLRRTKFQIMLIAAVATILFATFYFIDRSRRQTPLEFNRGAGFIALASEQLAQGRQSEALRVLKTAPQADRGWEWRHLWSQATAPPAVRTIEFSTVGVAAAAGREGRAFAVAAREGNIDCYHEDGNSSPVFKAREFPTHITSDDEGFVAVYQNGRVARFSIDGETSETGIFDIGSPSLCWPSGENDDIYAFDPDQDVVWRVNLSNAVAVKTAQADQVLAAYSAPGWVLLVNETDRRGELTIRLVDAQANEHMRDTLIKGEIPLAIDVDRNKLEAVIATTSGRILRYEIGGRQPPIVLPVGSIRHVVTAILVDSTEGRLFAAADDRLHVLDLKTGRRLFELPINIPGLTRDIRWDHQRGNLSLVTDYGVVMWKAPIKPNLMALR